MASCKAAKWEERRPWQGRHQFSEQGIATGKVSNDWKESRRFEKNREKAKHIFHLIQKFLQKMLQAIPLMFFHGIRWVTSFPDPAAILFPVGFILRTAPSLSVLSHSFSSSRKEKQAVGAGAVSSGWDWDSERRWSWDSVATASWVLCSHVMLLHAIWL